MSDVALIPVDTVRKDLSLTPDLARWVCAVEDGAEVPANLPAAVIAEATRQTALAGRLMTPVPTTVLNPWLALIAGHYAAAQRARTQQEASTWARTIGLAMEGMPVGVFTRTNLGEVLSRYGFLPTAAQLTEVLAPDRDTLERRAKALRLVAGLSA